MNDLLYYKYMFLYIFAIGTECLFKTTKKRFNNPQLIMKRFTLLIFFLLNACILFADPIDLKKAITLARPYMLMSPNPELVNDISRRRIKGSRNNVSATPFYVPNSEDQIVKLIENTVIRPFRAYFRTTMSYTSTPFSIILEDPTSINAVNCQDGSESAIPYDLNGRAVNDTSDGIYIVNGKKLLQKPY